MERTAKTTLRSEEIPFLPRQHDEDLIIHDSESETEVAELKKIIRQMNLKVTEQRLAILKVLQRGHRHITAQELYEEVVQKHPDVGFATVYRFLRSLTEGNFVTEVRMGGLPARYELTPKKHHDHLTCVECGKICEFENKTIESLQEKIAARFGFRLTHHVLELYGVCPECQGKKLSSQFE